MAKPKLPDPLTRRHLLEGELDPTKARGYADAYLANEREVDAIEFLGRAGAEETLAELCASAIERGDVFLMRMASQALGRETSSADWQALADRARAGGRERDADAAHRLATVGE